VAGDLGYFQVAFETSDSPPSSAVGRIYRTDGTLEGTAEHLPEVSGWTPTGAEDRLFFLFDERTHPPGNLWLAVTDEGDEVTLLVRSASAPLTPAGRRVFLSVTSSTGLEPWLSDGSPEGTVPLADIAPGVASSNPEDYTRVGDLLFFTATNEELGRELWAVRLSDLPEVFDPDPPYDAWIDSPLYPDFRFQVRITPSVGTTFQGREEDDCQPDTVCVSGALPGRSEAFLRILGPRGNGFYWPTVTRFTPSQVEVWIERVPTDTRRYYRLEAVPPGTDDLPGLQDRRGFPED
jgi:ELWxxDGT repeat protein